MIINVPTAASSSGHQYHLDEDDIRKVFNKQFWQVQKTVFVYVKYAVILNIACKKSNKLYK